MTIGPKETLDEAKPQKQLTAALRKLLKDSDPPATKKAPAPKPKKKAPPRKKKR
ncbi:MAG TPA: hypothetical protein VI386_24635 [Candidatus Sulfotelmatobacter sp.]